MDVLTKAKQNKMEDKEKYLKYYTIAKSSGNPDFQEDDEIEDQLALIEFTKDAKSMITGALERWKNKLIKTQQKQRTNAHGGQNYFIYSLVISEYKFEYIRDYHMVNVLNRQFAKSQKLKNVKDIPWDYENLKSILQQNCNGYFIVCHAEYMKDLLPETSEDIALIITYLCHLPSIDIVTMIFLKL
jgi:hypothetical protein